MECRLEYDEGLLEELERLTGGAPGLRSLLSSICRPPPRLYIRVNTLRIDPGGLLDRLRRVFGPEAVAEDGEAIVVRLKRDEELYKLLSLLSELKPRLDRLEARRLTLEDVYLSLYGGGGG